MSQGPDVVNVVTSVVTPDRSLKEPAQSHTWDKHYAYDQGYVDKDGVFHFWIPFSPFAVTFAMPGLSLTNLKEPAQSHTWDKHYAHGHGYVDEDGVFHFWADPQGETHLRV